MASASDARLLPGWDRFSGGAKIITKWDHPSMRSSVGLVIGTFDGDLHRLRSANSLFAGAAG